MAGFTRTQKTGATVKIYEFIKSNKVKRFYE